MIQKILWGEMTRLELKSLSEKVDTVLLPVGSIEQHGPHLPLDTDSFDAMYILEEAVKRLDDPKPPILPAVSYGLSEHHMGFKGTVTLRPETLAALVTDIGTSVREHGFRKMFIYNAHGGNTNVLRESAIRLKYDTGLQVYMDSGESMEPGKKELVKSENDVHAGEYETSTSLVNRGKLIDENKIMKPNLTFPHPHMEFDHRPSFFFTWYTHEITDTGAIGDPTKASVEKGKELWERGIDLLAKRIAIVSQQK
ncbi:MAG: creatininase family protein [Thermoplasmata archaeon]